MLLQVCNLNTYYGNLHALWDINFEAKASEIVALIGSNGAGKTTLLKSIAGAVPIKSGSIQYKEKEISGSKPSALVKQGITLSPEGRQIFPRMTVEENLRVGGYTRNKAGLENSFQQVFELFPVLKERRNQAAGTLSGGEQQMLAIGRALMSDPKLLMLDEPSLGLSPILTEKIFELILRIRETGITILLVEQNAMMALSIADRGYVLETGHVTKTGTGKELLNSKEMLDSYLGVTAEGDKN